MRATKEWNWCWEMSDSALTAPPSGGRPHLFCHMIRHFGFSKLDKMYILISHFDGHVSLETHFIHSSYDFTKRRLCWCWLWHWQMGGRRIVHNFHISILWYCRISWSNICLIYGDCCQIFAGAESEILTSSDKVASIRSKKFTSHLISILCTETLSFAAINWSNADGNQGEMSLLWLFLTASLAVQKIFRNFLIK